MAPYLTSGRFRSSEAWLPPVLVIDAGPLAFPPWLTSATRSTSTLGSSTGTGASFSSLSTIRVAAMRCPPR